MLTGSTVGCESLQRKFTRKPKDPTAAPSPILTFQDYTQAMTPLDRYRKHFLMFDYWNEDLMVALQETTPNSAVNPKRLKRSSGESLAELRTLKALLVEEVGARLEPLIEERATIDRQLQRGDFSATELHRLSRTLEAQTRRIHRDFYWRDVEDHLNGKEQPPSDVGAGGAP
ncbi:MAG: hypothetical protein HYZ91_00035 [Candidatus Omnitrophica bacterium]|nr:hypothetical protein [Candidatus Omnitrophota bacterium]